MKISFVEPHLRLFGGIRRIVEISNHLTAREHDVTIFHSDGTPCEWMECTAKVKSYDQVLQESHDAIIYNDPNTTDYELVEKADAKLKIFYVLGLYEKEFLIQNPAMKPQNLNLKLKLLFRRNRKRLQLLKKSLKSPYLKLSNATWEKQWLQENMGIDSELLIGGVNPEIFHPLTIERKASEIRILCSGDQRQGKGTSTILEAIEIAKKQEPEIVLDTYHGQGIVQEEMAKKYSSADIFVEASHSAGAGWNNPVAEAMACKVPVICTDIGAVQDFAFHEKTALLVPPTNPKAIAFAILRLVRDEKLRETLRENAYCHIGQFEWQKSAKRLEEIINSKLGKKNELFSKIHFAINNPGKALNKMGTMLKKDSQKDQGFGKYKLHGAYHWDLYKSDLIYTKHVDCIVENFAKKAKGSLLDVGCGDGLISSLLAKSGFKTKGIDKENEGIRLARGKCSSVDFEVKDIFDVNEQFDYLLASEIIEHLPDADKFLQKIKGLFKKEAFVTTPNKNYYNRMDPYHTKEYSIYEFELLLEKYFEISQFNSTEHHLYAWIKNKDGR
ncbi:MAG: glycosyltransferase [Planctomycetes bacterium]|nr:glycosyltransferase [Planctomycetota bacterium]